MNGTVTGCCWTAVVVVVEDGNGQHGKDYRYIKFDYIPIYSEDAYNKVVIECCRSFLTLISSVVSLKMNVPSLSSNTMLSSSKLLKY